MGESITQQLSQSSEFSLIGGISKDTSDDKRLHLITCADVILDFSNSKGNHDLLQALKKLAPDTSKAIIIGTTGLEQEHLNAWKVFAQARQVKILLAPNTSLGIILSLKAGLELAKGCFANGFDLEIHETHHREKVDAPSGTALFLASSIAREHKKEVIYGRQGIRQKKEIGISSTRGGLIFGEHELRFLSDDEEITITHRAFSRQIFAKGALYLASWLCAKKDTGVFSLEDVLLSQNYQQS